MGPRGEGALLAFQRFPVVGLPVIRFRWRFSFVTPANRAERQQHDERRQG